MHISIDLWDFDFEAHDSGWLLDSHSSISCITFLGL